MAALIKSNSRMMFGAFSEIKPIRNVPAGARYRLRFRCDDLAYIFIKTATGITKHYLANCGEYWEPEKWAIAQNETGNA